MAQDRYRYFRIEARELIDQLAAGVLALEKRGAEAEGVGRLLRAAHTLKGAARVVKQNAMADATHAIEGELEPLREAPGPVARARVDALLGLLDWLTAGLAALDEPVATGSFDSGLAHARPALGANGAERGASGTAASGAMASGAAGSGAMASAAAGSGPTSRPNLLPMAAPAAAAIEVDSILDGVAEAHTQLAGARRGLELIERASRLAELLAAQAPGKAAGLADELRGLIERAGRDVGSAVERIDRELGGVRDAADQLRLTPAASLFTALERTARDTAFALGRRVEFDSAGGDVRLDGAVVAAVQAALVQAVRNAVAHGIEGEAERAAAGKPAAGRIAVAVVRRGRRVTFTCQDDGRGIDVIAVRRALIRRGMAEAEAIALDTDAVIARLLRGGVSTSASVTEVAGRGVGLDVVREVGERLGGAVAVRTAAGAGTTVELTVPLSLATIDGLLVEAGGTTVAIPIDAVRRAARVEPGAVTRSAEGEAIVDRGQVIPFTPLRRLLRTGDAGGRRERAWAAVILEGPGGVAAIGADRLLGAASLVLRPLPELAPADPVVAGASFDAEGNPRLVLEPAAVVARVRALGVAPTDATPTRRPVLVIDDSLTTRMLEQSILESAGYQVDVAVSGEDGLDALRRKAYALILVDVEMPGIDGFTVIERMRADPALRYLPAILVTSRGAPEDRERGRIAGASGYMVKSAFDQNELLALIGRLLEGAS